MLTPKAPQTSWWRVLIASLLSLHLSWGLRVPRVDHPDEIWSIAATQRSYGELVAFILGNDSHPPLYYLAIRVWSSVAGDSITSARVLSYLFGLLTLLLFALFHFRSRPITFVAPLLLLASNPLFTYYSATIRPYAFLVFLASAAILSSMALRFETSQQLEPQSAPSVREPRLALQILFYGACLLLGLTHYYGLLYAMILLVWDFFERRISLSRLPTIIVAALLVVWPLLQIFFGTLDKQIESNAWVNVVPVVSTLNNFFLGLFPAVVVSRQLPYLFSLGLLLCLGSILLAPKLRIQSFAWSRICSFLSGDVGYLLSGLFLVYIFSLVADINVPFSTPYYFLVGLPATALLFGFWVRWMRQRLGLLPACLFTATIVLTQLALARQRLMVP
jgi:uncharacterized membrane protein